MTTTVQRPIPVAGPWITEKELAYVADAAAHDWYGGAGAYARRFEEAFASYVGRSFAISLPSCTSGLHLVLAALGVGAGDEVIVPESTWIASSAPIAYVGATPVFADVNPETWCLSTTSVEEAITDRTRAILAVDLYGGMPDYASLLQCADAHGVPLIEDAAEAIGSTYKGKPAGGFGIAAAFSFHGSKTVTTGEGGMVVTDDERLFQRMLRLRDHGRRPGDISFRNEEVGFKYKMSGMQAALGLAQLERVGELVDRKREIFAWYKDALKDARATLNAEPDGLRNSYWMTTIVLDRELETQADEVMPHLRSRGIETRPFFHPLSALPAYAHLVGSVDAQARNPVSYDIAPRSFNVPSALSISRHDVDVVVEELGGLVPGLFS